MEPTTQNHIQNSQKLYLPVSICVFIKRDEHGGDYKLWMQKRWEKGPFYNRLEFPGGKIEKGEKPEEACLREVREEVGLELELDSVEFFKNYIHHYDDRVVSLYVYLYFEKDGGVHEHFSKGKWFSLNSSNDDWSKAGEILDANHKILEDLKISLL